LEDERDKFEALSWKPSSAMRQGFQTTVNNNLPVPFEREFAKALSNFFKYDTLAKQLYLKLRVDTARRID
jgi:hypothetical protein